ncbi:MAG: hypothetical protein ACMUEM_02050 [Flavobacteriales bacterium AspAUS03]
MEYFIASDVVDMPEATEILFKSSDILSGYIKAYLEEHPELFEFLERHPSLIEEFLH